MQRILIAVLFFGFVTGCTSSGSTPVSPGPTVTFGGSWGGDLSVEGQSARMTWTLTQSGSSVSGPVLVALPNGVVLMNGSLSGTVNGSTLTYAINVGAGGIPTQPACTGRLDGTAMVASSAPTTMTGSYSVGTSTCQTGFSSGSFTLTK